MCVREDTDEEEGTLHCWVGQGHANQGPIKKDEKKNAIAKNAIFSVRDPADGPRTGSQISIVCRANKPFPRARLATSLMMLARAVRSLTQQKRTLPALSTSPALNRGLETAIQYMHS